LAAGKGAACLGAFWARLSRPIPEKSIGATGFEPASWCSQITLPSRLPTGAVPRATPALEACARAFGRHHDACAYGSSEAAVRQSAAGPNPRSTSGRFSSSWGPSGTELCWRSWGPESKPASSWRLVEYTCTSSGSQGWSRPGRPSRGVAGVKALFACTLACRRHRST